MTDQKPCTCKVPVPVAGNHTTCVNCGGLMPGFAGKQSGTLAGRVRTMPRCIGCGVSVQEGQTVCEVCAEKPQYQAPKATVQTGAQPTPAYQRPEYEGNFKPGATDARAD